MEIIFELRKIFFHEHLKPLIEEVDCSRIEKEKYTVVLDMDETMIKAFSSEEPEFYQFEKYNLMEPNVVINMNYTKQNLRKQIKVIFRQYLDYIL